MKIFISHKKEDSADALRVKYGFDRMGVESYLDVLDTAIDDGGEVLTEHIKEKLNECTDIIVVMSETTKKSWWVPFEIGMAAQIDLPTASYLTEAVQLPDYLEYWPRLKSISDIATYVTVRKSVAEQIKKHFQYTYTESAYRPIETHTFYNELKQRLR